MKELYLAELKKVWKPLGHKIAILCMLLVPVLILQFSLYYEKGDFGVWNGEEIRGQEIRIQKDTLYQELTGEIDSQWLTTVEQRLATYDAVENKENDLAYQTLYNAYSEGKVALQIKNIVINDVQTPSVVQRGYQENTLQYGPHTDWKLYFSVLSMGAIVYGIVCMYLFISIFNQEEESGTIDLIKSSKKGRYPITLAKISIAMVITVILGLVFYFFVQGIASLHLTMAGGDTTAIMNRTLQYMPLQAISNQALWIILLGGLICTCVSLLLSVLIKRTYVALGIGMTFIIIPIFISLNGWEVYFPSAFLNIEDLLLKQSWLNISDFYQSTIIVLSILWLPIMILLIGIIIGHQCSDIQIPRIVIRKWRIE